MKNKLLLMMILSSMLLGVVGCGNKDVDMNDNMDNPSHLPGNNNDQNNDTNNPVPYDDSDFDEGDYPEP